jgi:lipopolysaccharide/colanic/teichoic acid biosynthesis glycosyltransferase
MNKKLFPVSESTLGSVAVVEDASADLPVAPAESLFVARDGEAPTDGFPGKRVLDIAASLALLVATAPLMAFVAAVLKLAGNGPILFWQQRVGLRGRLFWFPKFSSMQPGSEQLQESMLALNDHESSITFKMRTDPRVTRLGYILRITSLDELPQLWSVLRGDMSLVGPRPPLPGEVACYGAAQRRRLDVKPGLTCIWQVSGRSEIPFDEQVRLDLQYIENQSIWLDLELLLRTFPAVLSCRGAY